VIKAKFAERTCSKTEIAQGNEMLLRILYHNVCVLMQSNAILPKNALETRLFRQSQ
jgi:hypothetical protein